MPSGEIKAVAVAAKSVAEAPSETIKAVTGLMETVGVKDLVQLGVSMTHKGVDAGARAVAKKSEERSSMVEVAEVYSSDYRLKLDDAKRWLEEDGLRAEAVVVKPDVAYKDCSEFEVVATNYELGKKVKPGTRIILRYVTSDVIAASQELFNKSEYEKAEIEQIRAKTQIEKAEKKAEQSAKTKQKLDETLTNVQHGLGGVVSSAQKGMKGLLSNIPKKSPKQD